MLDLPRQSQHAVVTQRIGITDITINYHRPLANGRQIWGKLAPYGQVWRAGANENTTITFSDPVTIEGQALDKGTYGLHMIPGENQWTVIFSKNSKDWGAFTYKQDEDALRVNVKPQTAEAHDALAYDFDDLKADSAVVTMRWDKVAVPFKVAGQRERPSHRQHSPATARAQSILLGRLGRRGGLLPGQQDQSRRSAEV